jgi:hypothetical protein
MVGYMTLEAQVDADFSRARFRALLRKVRIRLRRDKTWDGLLCFDDLRDSGQYLSRHEDGAGSTDRRQRRPLF